MEASLGVLVLELLVRSEGFEKLTGLPFFPLTIIPERNMRLAIFWDEGVLMKRFFFNLLFSFKFMHYDSPLFGAFSVLTHGPYPVA